MGFFVVDFDNKAYDKETFLFFISATLCGAKSFLCVAYILDIHHVVECFQSLKNHNTL